MNLIESLRNEVQEKESVHAAHMAEREAQQHYYEQYLRQPMLQTFDYFKEVVGNLKFLNTRTQTSLPLAPDGESIVAMEQVGYEFFYDDSKNPLRLDIVCECLVSGVQRFHLSTPDRVKHYSEFLDKLQFSYHRKTELDSRYDIRSAVFELEGPLRVGVTIRANPAERCIYIFLRNLEGMIEKRYQFSPEKVDLELLERLGRLILRQETTLVNTELSDTVRNSLSMQVEAEKKERDAALQSAIEEMRLAQQAEAEAQKISTKIRKLTSKLRSALIKES